MFHLLLVSTHHSCLQRLLTASRPHVSVMAIHCPLLHLCPPSLAILTFFLHSQPCYSSLFSKCTHPACTRSLPSALYMHHPSKLMTSLKGLLQYKVCILSNILSAFVLLPPPCFPKGSDFIYNILKWMGNYQAVLVIVQIKKLREMGRKQPPVSNI